ncbi:hypothetical protein ColLi_13247 [Colletotrichum liriopes]|uniref:Uncharacterized protein n=1 Tax=Colletotrichum liriopes TaxID=708192 RepID=A0AA37H0R7_9PEZI|nr:hypothetical protein ColLi_13247 [Colletotrichum liriopes]
MLSGYTETRASNLLPLNRLSVPSPAATVSETPRRASTRSIDSIHASDLDIDPFRNESTSDRDLGRLNHSDDGDSCDDGSGSFDYKSNGNDQDESVQSQAQSHTPLCLPTAAVSLRRPSNCLPDLSLGFTCSTTLRTAFTARKRCRTQGRYGT